MHAAAAMVMACGWLALSAGLTMAQDHPLSPSVSAAFDACTAAEQTASARFAILEDAGWRVAPDDAERSALAALIAAERFTFFEPGTPRYDEFIANSQSRLATDPAQMRDSDDAGLASGSVAHFGIMKALLATRPLSSVQLSSDVGGEHLSITIGTLDSGLIGMQCDIILASSIDDMQRNQLAGALGFDDSHAFVQEAQSGTSGVVYSFKDPATFDPLKVRFRAFDPDGTLAQMANDLALPVRIRSIIETIARPFPSD